LENIPGVDDFKSYINFTPDKIELETFPETIVDYMKEDLTMDLKEPNQGIFIIQMPLAPKTRDNSAIIPDNENIRKTEKKVNFGSIKNMITSLYPNLQKPNIERL
jgi:hypothetical protein